MTTPLKGDAKLPLYSTSMLCCRQFQYDFCMLRATSQAKLCMHAGQL